MPCLIKPRISQSSKLDGLVSPGCLAFYSPPVAPCICPFGASAPPLVAPVDARPLQLIPMCDCQVARNVDLINTYNITMILLSTTVLVNLLVALMGSTFIRHSNLGRQMWWLEFSDLVLRYERRLSAKVRCTVHIRVQSQGFLSISSLFLKYTSHDNLTPFMTM